VVSVVLVWFALLRDWGGLKRLFGIYPAVRAGMAGIAVAALIGGVLGGSALNVAGAAAALTVPLAALAALRVLDHSADRTRPPVVPLIEAPTPSAAPPAREPGAPAPGADASASTASDGGEPANDAPPGAATDVPVASS
jgi:hypothetical protein